MKKVIIFLLGLLFVGFHSCQEGIPEIALEEFMYITLTGSKNNPHIKKLDLGNSRDTTFNISISYGGTTNYNHGNIEANIDADLSLVNAFNADNLTEYLPMPAGSYSFNTNAAQIEDGKNSSLPLILTIRKSTLNLSNEFLLPVTVKSVSGGDLPLSDEWKTLYFVITADIDDELEKSRWTSGGASSVWQPGYEVENIFDGNAYTYWHTDLTGLPQWFIIDMDGFKKFDGFLYNNRKDLDQFALPKHILFEISNDKTNWQTALDIDELSQTREQQVLPIGHSVVAKYIRVTVLSSWNDAPYSYVAEVDVFVGDAPEPAQDIERHNWTILGYSSFWQIGTEPEKVLGNDVANQVWHTDLNGLPQWFSVDMHKTLKISGFIYHKRMNDPNAGDYPKRVVFEYSNDGATWQEALVVEELSTEPGFQNLPCSPVTARYFKMTIETNWGGNPWTYVTYISIF